MVPIDDIDGNPAEVARAACHQLQTDSKSFIESIARAEKFVRNAAMSEILEVNEDATPQELTDAWNSSSEKRLLDGMKLSATRVRNLQRMVDNYEGYVE